MDASRPWSPQRNLPSLLRKAEFGWGRPQGGGLCGPSQRKGNKFHVFLPKTTVTKLLCTQARRAATPGTVTTAQLNCFASLIGHSSASAWWRSSLMGRIPPPCVCMPMHVWVLGCMFTHACTRGSQRPMLSGFLHRSPPQYLRRGPSMNLAISARPAGL